MRDFIDAIFAFIATASLSDQEWESLPQSIKDQEVGIYNSALYDALIQIIDSRELVSTTRDRLTHFFEAKGVSVSKTSPAKSNIFVGSGL